MKVRIILNEEMLGMSPSSPDIYRDFIASKAPEAASREEEIEAIGVDEVEKKGITIFPKDDDGNPFIPEDGVYYEPSKECSRTSTKLSNGFGCTPYAVKNVCPDDNSKTYWECLP